MRFCTSLAIILTALTAPPAFAGIDQLSYQGRILKADGTAFEYSSVSFLFEITNPSGTCIIYREQKNGVNMSGSGGVFDVPIGSGTKLFPTSATVGLMNIFNNAQNQDCADSSNNVSGSYTPAATHGRLLFVQFHDGTGWKKIEPETEIRAVPYAGYAMAAEKLGSYTYDSFVLKTTLPTCTTGTWLTYDGSTFTCSAVSGTAGGTVTSITAGAGLTGGTIINSGTIALSTSGATAGSYGSATQVPVMTVDAYGRVTAVTNTTISGVVPGGTASGDLGGNYPSPTVSGLNGTALSIASLTSGQFLKYNGTNWVNATLSTSDISGLSSAYLAQSSFNAYVASASCTASQTMYWSSLSGAFACASISGVSLSGDVTGTTSASTVSKLSGTALSISSLTSGQYLKFDGTNWINSTLSLSDSAITYGSQTANTFFAAPNGSAGTPSFRAMVAADLPTVPYTRGGTGLTATPTNGQIPIGNGSGYTLGTLTAGSNVTITNAAGTITIAAASGGGTVTAVTANSPLSVTNGTTTPALSIQAASGSQDGYLSSADWTTFNSKQSTTLADGKILVGNSSNVATAVTMSGDATLANTGSLTLASSGVTAGTYPKVTVNAKGLVTSGSALSLSDLPTISTGTVLANVSGSTAAPSATTLTALLNTVSSTQGSILYRDASGWTYLSPGTSGQYLQTQGASANPQWATITLPTGTVTSVGLSLPSIFSVTNSPVTSSGTLTATLASQSANTVLAAPNGSAGTPSFRSLVLADLPTVTVPYGGTGLTSGTSGGIPYFASSTTMASSADLTQYGVVYGGGAGAAPATTAVGTSGYVLTSNGGSSAPSFQQVSLSAGVTGTLPVANGGTGATTATTARSNLSAAQSGSNADITSITNSTGSITLAPTGALALTPTTYVTSTVPYAGPLGSAAAPAFTNTTAPATGMYFPSSTSVGLATAGAARMVVNSSGYVGIGNTSPSALLDVQASDVTTNVTGLLLQSTDSAGDVTNATGISIDFKMSDSNTTAPVNPQARISGAVGLNHATAGGESSGQLLFSTSIGDSTGTGSVFNTNTLTERMRINEFGDVGIGTTSPGIDTQYTGRNYLTLKGTGTSAATGSGNLQLTSNATDASGVNLGNIEWLDSNNTSGVHRVGYISMSTSTTTANNRGADFTIGTRPDAGTNAIERFRITAAGLVGIGTTSPSATLHVVGTVMTTNNQGYWSLNNASTSINILNLDASNILRMGSSNPTNVFYTNSTERMRIDSSGYVGIGTTSPSYNLHVVGSAGLSTGTAWTNASDARLKDIHGDYEYGLNEVLKLHTVRYSYKKDNPLKLPSDFQKTGFIAQEVQKVIPDAVTKRKDGYLELNVDPIHWAVVNAVKELYKKWFDDSQSVHKKLNEHDTKLKSIENEMAALREQNDLLKKQNEALLQTLKSQNEKAQRIPASSR